MHKVLDDYPWWHALTSGELGQLELSPSNTGEGGGDLKALWGQTRIWEEGEPLVAELLGLDERRFNRALELAGSPKTSTFEDVPAPDWELTRRRWVQLTAENDDGLYPTTPYRSLICGAAMELRASIEPLRRNWSERAGHLMASTAEHLVDAPPIEDIDNLVTRSLIQELHQKSQIDEEVSDFASLLATQGFEQRLMTTYPVLTRLVVTRLRFWLSRTIEFLTRLEQDLSALQDHGFIDFDIPLEDGEDHFAPVRSVTSGAGDSHNQGRSVTIVDSIYGTLIYKPRGAANENALRRLRDEVFEDLAGRTFDVPRTIDRGQWSWQERIGDQVLETDEDLSEAAFSLGCLAAVIQVLGGNDFHHENVKFKNSRACPVDLETIVRVDSRQANQPLDENADPAFRKLMDSVAVAGIVPGKIISRSPDGEIHATDVSVVGYKPGQRTPMSVSTIESDSNGLPHIVERLIDDDGEGGQPGLKFKGREFLDGFLAGMASLQKTVEKRSPAYIVDFFKRAEFRYIPRPTMVYAKLLSESYHPFFLQLGAMRDVVLAKAWSGYAHAPGRTVLLQQEYADLLNGDIPHMVCQIDDHSWWDDDPSITTADRLAERITPQLESVNIAYQKRIIEQSFASIGHPIETVDTLAPLSQRSSTARRTASSLLTRALEGFCEVEGTLASTSLVAASAEHWTVSPLGFETYSGRAGVLLALNAVAEAPAAQFGEQRDMMMRSMMTMQGVVTASLNGDESARRSLDAGAASNLAGWLSCLTGVADFQKELDVRAAANDAVDLLGLLVEEDETFDIISGSAGAITMTTAAQSLLDRPRMEALLRKAAQHLMANAVEVGSGVGWKDPESGQLLCGFSHGAAGIGMSLLKASEILGDPNMREMGLAALSYDDSQFDPVTCNWPDLRSKSEAATSMRAWCHGAPGGILARALAWNSLDHRRRTTYAATIDAAAAATLQDIDDTLTTVEPDPLGDSLCHGRIGNLVVVKMLEEAGFLQNTTREHLHASQMTSISSVTSRGPHLGGVPGAPIPDLFMGLSGIGWGIHRLAHQTPEHYSGWEALTFGLKVPQATEGEQS